MTESVLDRTAFPSANASTVRTLPSITPVSYVADAEYLDHHTLAVPSHRSDAHAPRTAERRGQDTGVTRGETER